MSNTWYKGIKTVKYLTFPTCLWGFDGIPPHPTPNSETLHTWFSSQWNLKSTICPTVREMD